MPKNKPNKALLKRIRVTKNGRIKLTRAGGRHLRSHKAAKRLRRYRKPKYAVASEIKRIRSVLPAGVRPAAAPPAAPKSDEAD